MSEVPRYEKSDRAQMKTLVARIWNLKGDVTADVQRLQNTLRVLHEHCEALMDLAIETQKMNERNERRFKGEDI